MNNAPAMIHAVGALCGQVCELLRKPAEGNHA